MRKHFLLIALICSIFVACGPKPELPTVATVAVDYITENSASCAGEVVDDGNADIITQGFCWSTENKEPTVKDTTKELADQLTAENKKLSHALTELQPNTTYYIRAYVTNKKGTVYGEELTMDYTAGMPEVKTLEVTNKNIGAGTATFKGSILSLGDLGYTERGFAYATVHNPTIGDNKLTASGSGTGGFGNGTYGRVEPLMRSYSFGLQVTL